MNVKIISFPDIDKKVGAIVNTPASLFRDIMLNMRSRMWDRIKKSKDHNGRQFHRYAQSTVIAKEGIGRPANVNMSDRGTMLKSVSVKYTNKNGDMFLGAEKDIGYKHQMGIGVPKREWFGYTKESEKKARDEYEKYIKKALKK